MVHGATDAEARRKADTVDAELRNRKAAGERVVSIAVDRPEPRDISRAAPDAPFTSTPSASAAVLPSPAYPRLHRALYGLRGLRDVRIAMARSGRHPPSR